MFKRSIALLALACDFAVGQTPPDLAHAQVTIPYSELKDLWKAAQQNNQVAAKPPIAAALLSAHYDVELRGDQVVGVVEFEAQSFTDEWTLLPLVGSELQVEKIEPSAASIVPRDGGYALLTNHAGKQQIKMHFSANSSQEFSSATALVRLLTVRGIPADKTIEVANATPLSNEKGVATFRLLPQARIGLRVVASAKIVPGPSQWQTSVQELVRYNDDLLHYESHVSALASGGSAVALRLKLPEGCRVISISGEDLVSWRTDENHVIALQWRTPNIFQRQVDLVYEAPQQIEGEWKLRAPENLDGATQPAVFAITAEAALGLTSAEEPVVRPPRWLAEKISGVANVLVTRREIVTAKLLPVVDVAPAIIDQATFSTRIVSDGSLISEQGYDIHTSAALVWNVQLPENSELLSCAIDDRRVSPINRGDGTLEIPIAPLADGKRTRVALAYTSRTSPFHAVSGRVKVELPKTPLLINSLDWDLAIPADYEVAALEGNVGPGGGAKAREGSTVVHLKKELCRNERPAVELFYQRPEIKK